MKMKTSELSGPALDWAVAKCEGWPLDIWFDEDQLPMVRDDEVPEYKPSTDWSQGGPIIEREELSSLKCYNHNEWECNNGDIFCEGPTPLIAAMRCYVTSKLGDEIEVPEELK
jgi:hypothetical protein